MKTKKIPQETIVKQVPNEENEDSASVDASESSREPEDVIANWPELQKLLKGEHTLEELYEKGWRPVIKTKKNGKQYMALRFHGPNPITGDTMDTERGLGLLNPEDPIRYETLMSLFPQKDNSLPLDVSKSPDSSNSTTRSNKDRSSILISKVARVTPIAPTVQINLGTLQWYTWVQQVCGYPGKLDDFINDTVDSYFRAHHHLELAVVVQGGTN